MYYAATAPLLPLFDYLKGRGSALEEIAGAAEIALLRRAPARVPAWLGVDLFERCAARLDDPLFGLRYGQFLEPQTLGPISLLWRYAPTVRHSNRITMQILHLQHEAVAIVVREEGDTVTLLYRLGAEPGRESRQSIESGVSFMLRVCRLMLGASWVPRRVVFAHEPGTEPARYAEILGAPVAFGAADSGLRLAVADFNRRSPDYDADILAFVERSLLHIADQQPLPFRERLDRTIDDLLAVDRPRLTAAAAAMAMSTRTLQRQLTAMGMSYRDVVTARRLVIVENWRRQSAKTSLGRLAERTAYSDASAVSRFLRSQQRVVGQGS